MIEIGLCCVRCAGQASVRKGVLPRMLEEILQTRLMVKGAMKSYREDKALTRLLNARQLGLKLIANVTFGYTSANFSGRMPSVEVGASLQWCGCGRVEACPESQCDCNSADLIMSTVCGECGCYVQEELWVGTVHATHWL